jgi:hypothetical protein
MVLLLGRVLRLLCHVPPGIHRGRDTIFRHRGPFFRRTAYCVFAAVVGGCDAAPQLAPDAGAAVTAIADDYYALVLKRAPETAYLAAIDSARHDGLFDNRPLRTTSTAGQRTSCRRACPPSGSTTWPGHPSGSRR